MLAGADALGQVLPLPPSELGLVWQLQQINTPNRISKTNSKPKLFTYKTGHHTK
jgi:hypothetical protein